MLETWLSLPTALGKLFRTVLPCSMTVCRMVGCVVLAIVVPLL